MSKIRKLYTLLKTLLIVLIGLLIIFLEPEVSYFVVSLIIGIIITCDGIYSLFFYFTSAINMVGGGKILIKSILKLDFGLMAFFVLLNNYKIGFAYLIAVFIVLGVIDMVFGFEMRKNGSKNWKYKVIKSLLEIALSIACICYINTPSIMLLIFGIAWIVYALEDFVRIFRKTRIIYFDKM